MVVPIPSFSDRPPLDEVLALFNSLIVKQGVTTSPGNAGGTSIIDASLIGVGANSFSNMIVVVYPGDTTRVDAFNVNGFNNATGEITLTHAYKSVAAAIPAGVPYTIISLILAVTGVIADLNVPAVDSAANVLERDAIGNKGDSAKYAASATTSIIAMLKGILGVEVLATGTFTTSDPAVPADTGRTEADNYWNDCLLVPLSGAIAFQPRAIGTFAHAGGVFTLDKSYTAAPGLVAYAILPSQVSSKISSIATQVAKLNGQAPVTGSISANWHSAGPATVCSVGAAGVRYKVNALLIDISALAGNVSPSMTLSINGNVRKIFPPKAGTTFNVPGGDAPGLALINGPFEIANVLTVLVSSDAAGDDGASIGFEYDLEAM